MTEDATNGNGKLNRLLLAMLAALSTVVATVGVAWVNSLRTDVAELRRTTMERARLVGEYQTRMGAAESRISSLEARMTKLELE